MALSRWVRWFLRWCSKRFASSSPGSLPVDRVEATEGIVRFLLNRQDFGSNPPRVTHHAFMPNANRQTGRLEKSTHRTDGLTSDDIWALGQRHVENPASNRRIKARGTGHAQSVIDQGLLFDISGDPYPRHADIVGWSPDKDDRKMRAMQLANRFTLEMAVP